MNVINCRIFLKKEMLQGAQDNMHAWLRAKASVTLEGGVTLHGVVIRDAVQTNEVFVTFPKDAVRQDQYDVSDALRSLIEPQVIKAYQRVLYEWVSEEHEKPLHSMTLEILSGLREYYESVDLYCTQRDVDLEVRKLHPSEAWDQEGYLKVKGKVEKIVAKYEDDISK